VHRHSSPAPEPPQASSPIADGRLPLMLRALLLVLCSPLAVLTFAFVACDGGGDETPSPTSQPTRPSTPVVTPPPKQTPAIDIREIDIESLPDVQAALEEEGGTFAQTDVIYADVTNDGFDDAIAPISSGGTLGNIGFFVLTMSGTDPKTLLTEFPGEAGGLALSVEGEKIVLTQGIPGPDDPECCPSLLRKTVYAWNGTALAVESVSTEPNPDAVGGSITPAPAQ